MSMNICHKNTIGQIKCFVDNAPANNYCFLVMPASPFNSDTFDLKCKANLIFLLRQSIKNALPFIRMTLYTSFLYYGYFGQFFVKMWYFLVKNVVFFDKKTAAPEVRQNP